MLTSLSCSEDGGKDVPSDGREDTKPRQISRTDLPPRCITPSISPTGTRGPLNQGRIENRNGPEFCLFPTFSQSGQGWRSRWLPHTKNTRHPVSNSAAPSIAEEDAVAIGKRLCSRGKEGASSGSGITVLSLLSLSFSLSLSLSLSLSHSLSHSLAFSPALSLSRARTRV